MTERKLETYLFLDIETTSQYDKFDNMPQQAKDLFFRRWEKEIIQLAQSPIEGSNTEMIGINKATDMTYDKYAPLYAEWNKIICITVGTIDDKNSSNYVLNTVTCCGKDEKEILTLFSKISTKIFGPDAQKLSYVLGEKGSQLVAHNGLVFDIPVLYKRMVYNGMKPPIMFSIAGKKPWDVKWVFDTKEFWKCGVFDAGHNVSLDLLAHNFGVPSSKSVMQGKDVKHVYWTSINANDPAVEKSMLDQIEAYCEADVVALCQIFLKMHLIDTPVTHRKINALDVLAHIEKRAAKAAESAGQQQQS